MSKIVNYYKYICLAKWLYLRGSRRGLCIQFGWGVFNVMDSTILIEQYSRSSLNKKLTAIFSGKILNDTTFTLKERYKLDQNGDKYNVYKFDVTYYFRQYSSKPDSTNRYVK